MSKRPRSEAQERTARENLAKANKLAFTRRDAAAATSPDPPAKPKTYRAGISGSSGEPSGKTEPTAAAPATAATPSPPLARASKKGFFDDVLGSIFG